MPRRPGDSPDDSPRGPRADLARLYDRVGPSLYRYALMILADHALAEDIVHDVFGTLSARAGHVLHTPDAYLRRAVRNACYDALRKQRTRRTDTVDAPFLESLEASADRPDERIAIERALRSLPPDQREVVHLKIFEGLTFQEIADATETPPNTVASRYRYALDKLRLVLGADKPEPSRGR